MAEFNLDYTPREQFKALHTRTRRWSALVCHRRAGKTVAAIYETLIRSLYTPKKNARYAYIAPFYKQAKDVAWQYLKEATAGLAVETRESDLRVILPNGAWITLYGADNPDALRGIYLDGVVLDEYGDCKPSLWGEVILPTLADRKGWAIFIGTIKGKNHFYHTLEKARTTPEKWFYMCLKASESGILDDDELLELKGIMDEAQYMQEFECDPTAAIKGAYYAGLIQELEAEGKIAAMPDLYDRNEPVFAALDLGRKDSTAIWFWQEHRDTIDVIDYMEIDDGVVSNFITYFKERPYTLTEVWVPHDAKHKTAQTLRAPIQQFKDAGINARLVPSLARQQGIDAVRMMLPTCRIDSSKCYEGIEALRAYKREYNEKLKVFRDVPLHNWASDGADGFRYLALVAKQKRGKMPQTDFQKADEPIDASPKYCLEELFHDNEKSHKISVVGRRI